MKTITLDYAQNPKVLDLSKNYLSKDFLFIKTATTIHCIKKSRISHLQADGNYTLIFAGDQKVCSSKTLKYYADLLNERQFFRSHHSYLVNIDYVDQFCYGISSEILLLDGTTIPVSRSKKHGLVEKFSN